MRVLVLGGGIAGVTAGYYLAKDGHEVTLVEEQEGVGRDASAANAGIVAPGHSFAWASPKAPAMLLRSLLGQETAIRVRPRLDPELVAWGLRFLRECTAKRARRNTRPPSSQATTGVGPRATSTTSSDSPATCFRPPRTGSGGSTARASGR